MKPFTYNGTTVLVSNRGKVYFKGKEKRQYDNGSGYMSISIKEKLFYVHRIVCEVYKGLPINDKMQVNHLNGIRNDNSAKNLQWTTSSGNHIHAWRVLGRVHAKPQLGKSGFLCHNSKSVNQIDLDSGEVINIYGSIREAAKIFCVSHNAILNVIKGKRKRCKGYIWAYS